MPMPALVMAVALLGLVAAPVSGLAAPGSCVSAKERQALDTRVLQTELLIAALSCGQAQQYNQFVTAFQPQLAEEGSALQDLFRRMHGKKSEYELNEFVTKLANDSSTRSQKIGYGYCYFTWDLFTEILAGKQNEFRKFTEKPWIPSRHGFRQCEKS